MTTLQIRKKLDNMLGRSFEYAKQIHVVKSISMDSEEEKFEIRTNLNTFKRKFESADGFFKYWYEQPENHQIDNANQALTVHPQHSADAALADELVTILKEGIEKVKVNKDYIPQAKAINNNINSILHVQRLKLEYIKQMKK